MLDNPTASRGVELGQDLTSEEPQQESVVSINNMEPLKTELGDDGLAKEDQDWNRRLSTEPLKTEGLVDKRVRLDDLTARQKGIGEQIATRASAIDGGGSEINTDAIEAEGDTVEDIQNLINQLRELRKEQELTKEQVVAMEAEENVLLDQKASMEYYKSKVKADVKRGLFSKAGKLGNIEKNINKINKSLGMWSYDERFNGALKELQDQKEEFRAQLNAKQDEYKQTKEGEHPVDKFYEEYIGTIEENLKALREGKAVENVESLLASMRLDAEDNNERSSQVEAMEDEIESENSVQRSRQAGERSGWLRERFGNLVDKLSNVTAVTKRKIFAGVLAAVVLIGGFSGIRNSLKSSEQSEDVMNIIKETPVAQTQQIGVAEASALPGGATIGENWKLKTPELPDEIKNPKLETESDLKTPDLPDLPDSGIGSIPPPEGGDQGLETGSQGQVIDRDVNEWVNMAKEAGYNNEAEVRDLITSPDFVNIYNTFTTDKGITEEAARAALRVYLANRANKGDTGGNDSEIQMDGRPSDRPGDNEQPTITRSSEKQDVFYEKPGGHDKDWWRLRADQLGKASQFDILWGDKAFRSNLESGSYTNHDTAEKAKKAGQQNVTFMGDSNNRNMPDPDNAALSQALEQSMHERNLGIRGY